MRRTLWPIVALLVVIGMITAADINLFGAHAVGQQGAAGPAAKRPASASPEAPARTAGSTVTVEIKNFAFEPAELTVPPGTRVIFVNRDATPHNVVEGTSKEVSQRGHHPRFASPELSEGESWEIVFDEEGAFDYACTVAGHYLMGMTGTIHVKSGASIEETAAASEPAATAAHHEHTGHRAGSDAAGDLAHDMTWTPEGLAELAPFRVEGGVKEFAIDIREVQHELVDGVTVTAWAFNGTVPGPLLRVKEGDRVRVHFTNSHHQPHTIHWHGIYTDQAHDGVPHTSLAVMPGETYVYEFVAESAGTYMYHCHVDSYRHIDMGMYGALVIEPQDGKTWDREYTFILDDWDSAVDPLSPRYEPEHDHFLVNGKAFPQLPTLPLKVGETTRVRLINAGYSNVAMHLHGPHFQVVATDGRPLPQPYEKDTLDIAPGERYEIEIRPTKAGMYPFHAHNIQYVRNNGSYPGGMHLMFDIVDGDSAL